MVAVTSMVVMEKKRKTVFDTRDEFPDGDGYRVDIGAADIGTGSWTVLAQVAADALGIPYEQVDLRIGDTDLPNALDKALLSFDHNGDRQRVVLFLGDGMSVHNPMTEEVRTKLCEQMVKEEIAFFFSGLELVG